MMFEEEPGSFKVRDLYNRDQLQPKIRGRSLKIRGVSRQIGGDLEDEMRLYASTFPSSALNSELQLASNPGRGAEAKMARGEFVEAVR
jgi:hypothetical protein